MADKFAYTCKKPARLLFSSVTVKTAPREMANVEPKFSGTFGIEKEDLDAIIKLEVEAIRSETGGFTSPGDYYLAAISGETAAKRELIKATLGASNPKLGDDEKAKIMEKAETRAAFYRGYAGILVARSKYDVSVAKWENGAIVDIDISTDFNRVAAGKDYFYNGAYVRPAVSFFGFRAKTIDAKSGASAYLHNCMFVAHGERLGGTRPSNKDVFGGFTDYDPTDIDVGSDKETPASAEEKAYDF